MRTDCGGKGPIRFLVLGLIPPKPENEAGAVLSQLWICLDERRDPVDDFADRGRADEVDCGRGLALLQDVRMCVGTGLTKRRK